MLRELVFRDWRLNRRTLLFSFAFFFAFQIYSVMRFNSDRAWLVFAAIYASFLALIPIIIEDTSRATAWTCTLPVSRTDVVRARFLAAWALAGGALVATALLPLVVPGSTVEMALILQPGTLLMVATAVTLVIALMQPFTIRFGMLGVMIFLIGAQVLGAVLFAVVVGLNRSGGGGRDPIRLGFSMIGAPVVAVQQAVPPAVFVLLVLAALGLLNWLGYRLSLFLFRRRDL